jgi:glycerophosphoryl diester phosphodiesterase
MRRVPMTFDLQGHRGARGLKPENTLPSFEAALDAGVTTVETDVHLTRDGVPILFHDPAITGRLCRRTRGSTSPDPATQPPIRGLTLAQLRGYRADRNPDRRRFPNQDRAVTPLARQFARQHGLDPYTPPTVADLFLFAAAYAGEAGASAGKTDEQRDRAGRLRFDLELKRVPYHPEAIGDDFDGDSPGVLERQVVAAVVEAGLAARTTLRSFDHRAVLAVRRLGLRLTTAVLIAETAPVAPADLARAAEANVYCPDYRFLDERLVRQCHDMGVRVVPWTANDEPDWLRLLGWGVDGITTDYPDRLAALLSRRGIPF